MSPGPPIRMGAFALLAECWRLFRARRENPLVQRDGWVRGWLVPLVLFAVSCGIVWYTLERRMAGSGIEVSPSLVLQLYLEPLDLGLWLTLWLRDIGAALALASLAMPTAFAGLLRPRFAREDAIAELRTTPLHPREILFGAAWPMIRAHVAFAVPMAIAVGVCLGAALLGLVVQNSERITMELGVQAAAVLAMALLAPAVSLLLAIREFARERCATLAGAGRVAGGTLAVVFLAFLLPRIATAELVFLFDELWNPNWSSAYNDVILPSQRWLLLAATVLHLAAAAAALLATARHTLDFSAVQFTSLRGEDSLAREWWRGDGAEPAPPLTAIFSARVVTLAGVAFVALAGLQAVLPRPIAETGTIAVDARVVRRGEVLRLMIDTRGHEPPPVGVVLADVLRDGAEPPPGVRVSEFREEYQGGIVWVGRYAWRTLAKRVSPGLWEADSAFLTDRGIGTVLLLKEDGEAELPRDSSFYYSALRQVRDHHVPFHPALDSVARGIGMPGSLTLFLISVAFAALRVPRQSLPAAKPLRWAARSLWRPAFLFGSVLLAAAMLEGRVYGAGNRHTLDSYMDLGWYFIAVGSAVFLASMRALIAIPAARNPRLAAATWIMGGAIVAIWLNRSAVAAGNMVLLPLTDRTPAGMAPGLLALAALLHFGFGEALYQRLRDERAEG